MINTLIKQKNLWIALLTYIGVMNAFCLIFMGVNGDKSIIIFQSGQWFAGLVPYKDFMEVNLPMNMMLVLVAHALGSLMHFSLQQVANLHVYLVLWFCVFVIFYAHRMLQAALQEKNPLTKTDIWVSGAILWGFGQAGTFVADREFMMMAFIFLYLLRFSPLLLDATLPRSMRFVIGLIAAIGFCIKPHAIILWLSIQLVVLIRTRSCKYLFYLENIIIYAFGSGFLLYVYIALPDYFQVVLPLAQEFYLNYSLKNKFLLLGIWMLSCTLFAATGVVDWRPGQRSPFMPLLAYFASVLTGCFIYAAVNNGWAYTMVPAWTLALLVVFTMFKHYQHVKAHDSAHAENARQGMIGIVLVLFGYSINTLYPNIVMFSQSMQNHYPMPIEAINIYKKFVGELAVNHADNFAALEVAHLPWYNVATYSGKKWNLSINHYWMVPRDDVAYARIASDNDKDWRYRFMVDRTIRDIELRKPGVFFVPVPCTKMPECKYRDVFGLLSHSKRFTEVWQRSYRFTHIIDICEELQENPQESTDRANCRYNVYTRIYTK